MTSEAGADTLTGDLDFSLIVSNVAVITTVHDAQPSGCTASVWAEAIDPPLMLTTLARTSRTRGLILEEARFCVNLLGATGEAIAETFASPGLRGPARFEHVEWRPGAGGLPVLAHARAAYECALVSVHPFGSHDIIVGEARCWSLMDPVAPPLVYFRHTMTTVEPRSD